MSDYPKQMWHSGRREAVTVYAEPDRDGNQPARFEHGTYGVVGHRHLSPIPSPDDIVQVTVEVTRAQRDELLESTKTGWIGPNRDALNAFTDACRAHRDAEENQ